MRPKILRIPCKEEGGMRDFIEAFLAVLAFISLPFATIALAAGFLVLLNRLKDFLRDHNHHGHPGRL